MALIPPKTRNDLFLRAALGQTVERTPVWAMRQAGRWDPEFQKLRAGRDFFSFSENAELAAMASLCPRRFGVDAIILFYDITTLAVSMGQHFELIPDRGPMPSDPIRTTNDVMRLTSAPKIESFQAVADTLALVRRELDDELPVLVFAGAPFTLATYQVGIGKDLTRVRALAREHPDAWCSLLEKTTNATVTFLSELMQRGATAFQLFDSWAGLLTDTEYLEWCLPFHQRIFAGVDGLSILFVKEGPLDRMAQSGAKVVSLGTTHNLTKARREYPHLAFQGNVDHMLLVHGTLEEVSQATHQCLMEGNRDRHILNLDHGMDRNARVENFEAFINTAKN